MEARSAVAIEVEDLDAAGVLDRIADAERRDREVQAGEAAAGLPVVHPPPRHDVSRVRRPGATRVCPGCRDCDASLGGDGTPGVAPFVAEELGAAMGISTQSAMSLMADALDLRHRLPQLWEKVEALEVAPYKTRRVADDTRSLPLEGARWVDEQLAHRVDGFGLPTIERLVALAAARYAPEEQAEKEQESRAQHHVTLVHPRPGEFAGTSHLEAAGDTKDLAAFYALVCAEAKHLGRLGDTDDYETRKAKALGIIAGRQGALEITDETTDGRTVTRRPVQTKLYVHLSLADLAAHAAGIPTVGEVEKLGPATLDLIRAWLARLQGHHHPGPRPRQHRRRSTGTTRHRGCASRSSSATATASSPGAARTPGGPTSTTSSPTSHPTKADHPARPTHKASHHSAGDTTEPRPSPAGPTNAPATAPTPGPAPTAAPSPSDPTAHTARVRPHPPTAPRRTPSPPERAQAPPPPWLNGSPPT